MRGQGKACLAMGRGERKKILAYEPAYLSSIEHKKFFFDLDWFDTGISSKNHELV